jgi:hypothetical protein
MNHYIEAVNYGLQSITRPGPWPPSRKILCGKRIDGNPCDAQAHGDPVVVYDQFADRWIISHFAFGFDSIGYPTGPFTSA